MGQGDDCNKDWSTAAGPPVKCYNCNSMTGTCTGEDAGALEECPIQKRKGCYISKDLGKQGQGLHYCNCVGNACNENWSTAGAGTMFVSVSLSVCVVALTFFL